MRAFYERHKLLLTFILPVLFVSGAVASPVALVFAVGATIYLLREAKHDSIILLLIVALIFGDTRIELLFFAKPLRVVLMVILSAYSFWEFRLGLYQINRMFLAFMPFVAVSILGLTISPSLGLASSKTMSFIMLYFVGFHYIHHRFRQYQIVLLKDIMYLCHLVFFIGLIGLPFFPGELSYGGMRFNGLLGNPNGLGLFSVMLTPITAYVFSKQPNISKKYRTLAWFAIFLSLAMCSSRNSILSVTIFWVTYLALRGNSWKGMISIFVIGPLIALFFLTVDLVELVYFLGLEKYLRLRDIESGSGRVHAWEYAYELFWYNPLIGCGFACEEYNFIYRMNYKLWATGHQGGVHNSYLAFLVNTGVVGCTFYFGYILAIFRKMRSYYITLPILLSFATSAVFESWLFSSLSPFHILFLVVMIWFLVDSQFHDLIESKLREKDSEPNIAFIS